MVHRLEIHKSDDRFRTTAPGLDSRHSFSFGPHYDPANLGFGPLMVSNEDRLDPGAGYDRHAHRGVDIVTWMVAGTLEHDDSTGHRHRVPAGSAQRLRAGSGVHHAEHAAESGENSSAHYVQMWLRSADPDAPAHYSVEDFSAQLDAGDSSRLVTVATGDATDAVLTLDQPGAEFLVARLPAGAGTVVPAAPLVHVFVARGEVRLDVTWDRTGHQTATRDQLFTGDQLFSCDQLFAGDAARITAAEYVAVLADADAEILVWRLPA